MAMRTSKSVCVIVLCSQATNQMIISDFQEFIVYMITCEEFHKFQHFLWNQKMVFAFYLVKTIDRVIREAGWKLVNWTKAQFVKKKGRQRRGGGGGVNKH